MAEMPMRHIANAGFETVWEMIESTIMRTTGLPKWLAESAAELAATC